MAAIDTEGNLVHYLIKQYSIKKEDFIDFLDETRQQTGSGESFVFLDNLRAHHSKNVKETA